MRPSSRPPGRSRPTRPAPPDAIVIGVGLVGLSSAVALAERGRRVLLLADVRRGEASPAAAGILAPSVDRPSGPAHAFAVAARERFPSYVAALAEATGIEVPLARAGVLLLAERLADVDRLREEAREFGAEWLDTEALARLEPGIVPMPGAVLYEDDAVVNNLVLMRALKAWLGRHPKVMIATDAAEAITFRRGGVEVRTRSGARVPAAHVVLAGGAWSPQLEGVPRRLPIEPMRGQMLSVAATLVRHVVIGEEGYLVPRGDGRTLLGGTMERVGFDASTTEEGLALVRARSEAICPAVGRARTLNGWAGLRPMTPDLQPIIGPDPDEPALVYACGHSRNGILLSALTGETVGALVCGEAPAHDLSPFRPDRFPAPGAP